MDWFAGSDAFRRALRCAGSCTYVLTTQTDGVLHGMTATAVCSVSMDPPVLLVIVNQSAGLHDPLTKSGHFCANLLKADQRDIADRFSSKDPEVRRRRFEGIGVHHLESGAPALSGAAAAFDCRVIQAQRMSSHTIFWGEVDNVHYREGADSLLYQNGAYGRVSPLECHI